MIGGALLDPVGAIIDGVIAKKVTNTSYPDLILYNEPNTKIIANNLDKPEIMLYELSKLYGYNKCINNYRKKIEIHIDL